MRKVFALIWIFILLLTACSPITTQTATKASTSTSLTKEASTEVPQGGEIGSKLQQLGGTPCEENRDFTCVTIEVPLNHFDKANKDTIKVVFAISPATEKRYGMFVQAFPGGPGGEGISTGGLNWFSEDILKHYDIVYFDQRGVGLSNPLSCPQAYKADFMHYLTSVNQAGLEGYDTPEEQKAVVDEAHDFVQKCVTEIGIDPAKLSFFGTDQVAEDLESFRQAMGDDKFMLYGVSYGTAVAETYAAAHPDHLSGLILDGTINLVFTGEEGAFSQEKAFDKVLVATLNACTADQACKTDMGGDALAVYDKLAKQISEKPVTYKFPLPSGKKVERQFTFNEWEYTAAYQLYSLSGRMLFLRALAAANRGDFIPMARLMYQQLTIDPSNFDYIGDPTFSDTMFLDVLCTDDSFYAGTPEQKVEQVIQAGQASNGTVPRLDGSVYTGLDCAYWPSSPKDVLKTPPLVAKGVPTFVLDATMDPATPFEEGKTVYRHLDDGYFLYVNGGRHSIYGFGYDCPDQYITDFLVDGKLPEKREILCDDWGADVTRAYQPWISPNANTFSNVLDIFSAIDNEIQLQPEYFYSDFSENQAVACPYGGSFTFGPGDDGETYTFNDCTYTRGFNLSGTGGYDTAKSLFTMDVHVSGLTSGDLVYTRNDNDGKLTLTGTYDYRKIDLSK